MKKILVAEVNPTPKAYIPSNDMFTPPIEKDCPYMLCIARPYTLGASSVNFEVQFGVVKTQGDIEIFGYFIIKNVEMTQEELQNWGINDEACCNAVAQKLGLTCVSFKEVYAN